MKPILIMMVAAFTALAGGMAAQDKDRDRSRDQLRGCDRLSVSDCAELFWVRERLRDCSEIAPDDCAALILAREELEACAADRNHHRNRDCDQVTN